MSSRQNEPSLKKISPSLFLTESGKPMRFFLRPGPGKVYLQPIISAGGGTLCGSAVPNAIRLANPKDMETVVGSTASLYVSTQYILDCVKKNKQLDMENYRFKPAKSQTRSGRKGSGLDGRMCYMPEEDAAILDFISNTKHGIGGNKLWQEMEKQRVTNRSWQSMKDRYRKILAYKVQAEKSSEIELDAQQNDTPQPSRPQNQQGALELLPRPEHSADSDVPEPDVELDVPEPAPESDIPEPAPETNSPEPATECDIPEPAPGKNIPKMASTEELPQISSVTAALPHTSPQPHTDEPQTELPVESQGPPSPKVAPEEADRTLQPSAKRARIDRQASEGDPGADGATARSGENAGSDPVIHKETEPKGKTKRELGILARASMEFEESDEETQDLVDASCASPTEAVGAVKDSREGPAPLTQRNTSNTDAVAQPRHQATPQPDLQGECSEAQGPSESRTRGRAGPGLREPVPSTSTAHMLLFDSESQEVECSQPIRDEVAPFQMEVVEAAGPGQREPVPPASTAHRFLLDSESQEVETSQPIRDEVAFSQIQLEEVKRRIKGLMKQTNQDLESVTKALLKTSGDWSASLSYLMDGKGAGPFWDRHDDNLLLAGHTTELQTKYGEEGVAKRLAFLDTELNS